MQDSMPAFEARPKAYAGIDPGSDGYLSVLLPGGRSESLSFKEESPYKVADAIRRYSRDYDLTVTIEEVHSVHGSSAKSNFSFGYNVGMVTGFLIAHEVKYVTVPPKEWQREVWVRPDKVADSGGKVDTKKTSINAARRLFPAVDLRRGERCKTPHDGKCDSLLLAEYGRRKNL